MVLADVITAENMISHLPVKICLFVLKLILSVGLFPTVICPLKATLLIYYQTIVISNRYPFSITYFQ